MTDFYTLRRSYDTQVKSTFSPQDTIKFSVARRRIQKYKPRGAVYERLMRLEVAKWSG